jgi:hypothetical protein
MKNGKILVWQLLKSEVNLFLLSRIALHIQDKELKVAEINYIYEFINKKAKK